MVISPNFSYSSTSYSNLPGSNVYTNKPAIYNPPATNMSYIAPSQGYNQLGSLIQTLINLLKQFLPFFPQPRLPEPPIPYDPPILIDDGDMYPDDSLIRLDPREWDGTFNNLNA